MPLIGPSISGISRRMAATMCISILIRFGRMRRSILSASTIICPCRIGAKARLMRMRNMARFTISRTCAPILRGVKDMIGITTLTKHAPRRLERRLRMVLMMRLGSIAIKTCAIGGRARITRALAGCAKRRRRTGSRRANPSGSRKWAVRRSIRPQTSPTSFWTPSHPKAACRGFPPVRATI